MSNFGGTSRELFDLTIDIEMLELFIGSEIISMTVFSLPLNYVEQLSVAGEINVNLPRKRFSSLTDRARLTRLTSTDWP